MASIVGKALRGFGKALRAHRIKHGGRGKTISSVKPMSGKVPWYIGAGGKNPGKRKDIVITHSKVKKTEKIDAAEKQVKEGKENLKKLVDTGQAEKIGERHFKKGFD